MWQLESSMTGAKQMAEKSENIFNKSNQRKYKVNKKKHGRAGGETARE